MVEVEWSQDVISRFSVNLGGTRLRFFGMRQLVPENDSNVVLFYNFDIFTLSLIQFVRKLQNKT